jgi:hypothetical protein
MKRPSRAAAFRRCSGLAASRPSPPAISFDEYAADALSDTAMPACARQTTPAFVT